MGAVQESILVRRPADEVAKVAADSRVVLPLMAGFGRFEFIRAYPDGSEEWDLFLRVGTIQVGGRVLVETPDDRTLTWQALRGTRHHARLEVTEEGEHARIDASITIDLVGLATAQIVTFLAGGILRRHLQAGLEMLRHHVEYGDR